MFQKVTEFLDTNYITLIFNLIIIICFSVKTYMYFEEDVSCESVGDR